MNPILDDESIVGLATVGIHFADKRSKECQQICLEYSKNSNNKINQDFPWFDPTSVLSFLFNNVTYTFKAVLYSANNDYAIIWSDNYSVFKISGKQNSVYKIYWKGKTFDVELKITNRDYQITINNNYAINIQLIEPDNQTCSPMPFTMNLLSSSYKLNSILENCLSELNNTLNGFILPEPFFLSNLNKNLENIFTVLRDPLLPSLQFQSLLENSESSLPSCLLNDLRQIIVLYASNYSSVFSRFPSTKILSLINRYLDSIGDQSTKFNMTTILRPILELAEMYSDGIRGNAKHMIDNLFQNYRRVEVKFQDEYNITNANTVSKSIFASDVFSHNCLTEKNKLILSLIEYLEKYLPGLVMDLKPSIHKLLNSINGAAYSQIISKLREILITGQIPSYEVRRNEIEAIFLNSINRFSNSISTSRLEQLIYSNSEIFDIMSDFFYHKMVDLRKCALEVYIRRAYMAYEIHSFKQSQLSSGQLCVIFQFTRLTSSKNINVPKLKRSNSFVALNNNPISNCNMRKYSQIPRKTTDKVSPFYLDSDIQEYHSDYISEFNFISDKARDNDTDSAISTGAHSMSETSATVSDQVEFDSIGETFANQNRTSPSVRSLEEISNIHKSSDISLDSLVSYKWKRNSSIFSHQLPLSHYDEFIGNLDTGIMAIFNTLDELDGCISGLSQLISSAYSSNCSDYLEYDFLDQNQSQSSLGKVVINVALNDPDFNMKFDNEISTLLQKFCQKHSSYLTEINVSRLTFLLQSTDKSIRFYTFRQNTDFEEDYKVRQIDPALAFQLEISRLRNYNLERLPVLNRRMYVYLGQTKTMTLANLAEYRMFVRCIIHHNDINSSYTNIDFMAKEAEKSLLEAMDAFDIAWIDNRANLTAYNHIFFYFHSVLSLNKVEDLESVVRSIILKYGSRLWSLRITQAELKMTVKFINDSFSVIPIRLWVHNEGGKSLDICVYREEFQNNTDHKILMSWSSSREGRYHGVPVDCFYSI